MFSIRRFNSKSLAVLHIKILYCTFVKSFVTIKISKSLNKNEDFSLITSVCKSKQITRNYISVNDDGYRDSSNRLFQPSLYKS